MINVGNTVCPKCGGALKYYGTVNRIVRTEFGYSRIIKIKRFKCSDCQSVHRELPAFLLPYKQYEKRIIVGVLNGSISSGDILYEDYPCETTMNRWRSSQKLQLLL